MDIPELTSEQKEARRLEIIEILKKRSWYEEIILIAELHALSQEIFGAPDPSDGNKGGWSLGDTAKAINQSRSATVVNIRLAKCCQVDPLISGRSNRSIAIQEMYLKFYWVGSDKIVRRTT